MTCSFQKAMGDASGSFSFTLSNSPGIATGDWKDIIKRGTWCVIYMSQDGDLALTSQVEKPIRSQKKQEAKKIRCIGYIDRVAVNSTISDNGAFDVTYEVSGRDFGVVYEDTTIWHNLFRYDQIQLQALAANQLNITGSTSIDKALDIIHDLFFNPVNQPGAKVNDQNSLTSIALQWLLPKNMLSDIGLNIRGDSYWGKVPDIKNFSPTLAGIAIEKPTDYLSGNAWEQFKKISSPELHELFTETDDNGLPRLTFRPIPFAIDKRAYPTVGKEITLYKDLEPLVEVPAIDVVDFNLGEDNHSRYNSFLVTVSTGLINTEDNVSLLRGTRFPFNIQDSIKRHGFRAMHVTVDTIVKNAERSNGKGNPKILKEFNEVMYDYWNNAIFAETGSATLVGNNQVKIGKALRFGDGTPYVNGKRYYIEGYADSYTVEENGAGVWVQNLSLTRGFSEEDLRKRSGFGSRDSDFVKEGEYTPSGSSTNKKANK